MALNSIEVRLQRVTKLPKKVVEIMIEGSSLETSFTRPLIDIMDQTVADRLDLADEFLTMADTLMRSRSDLSRPAIARYYYAMYHSMRAAAYQHFSGDDHEAHSILSSKGVPPDYPSPAIASNDLKDARLLRNEADYDQYPIDRSYFKTQSKLLRPTATLFVASARNYVQAKGNPQA